MPTARMFTTLWCSTKSRQAIAALLKKPCAAIYDSAPGANDGFTRALAAMLNTQYSWYQNGMANPYPKSIPGLPQSEQDLLIG